MSGTTLPPHRSKRSVASTGLLSGAVLRRCRYSGSRMSSGDPQPSQTAAPYGDTQMANVAAALLQDRQPQSIGPYRVLKSIGEGGMGSVYLAQQEVPIHRTVAVKVIKLGMDTKALLARFEAERDALAMLSHPNIAQVLDAGTTEAGRPYFVLEYVEGKAISAFADDERMSIAQRLALMQQVCAAVQHAHQKAILHRDLKPSNILVKLVDGQPVVKVIDFGVAKVVRESTPDRTMYTEVGQRIGTLEYMSPEQAQGSADIDTRSDVYSLGVVLYQLLCGTMPFDPQTLRQGSYDDAFRIIREVDPPRASLRFTRQGDSTIDIAQRRRESPSSLAQQLKNELDWIVAKALRKDRNERYSSPKELAEDIENYLHHRPLRAGPETTIYRVRKFVRRNRGTVTAASIVTLVALVGIGATVWQAVRATRAERAIRAEQQQTLLEKQRAEAANEATSTVKEFLAQMLESVDPENARGRPVLVREVLDGAAKQIDGRFANQPRIEAELRATIGATYQALGAFDQAEPQLLRVAQAYESLDGPLSRQSLRAKLNLAVLRNLQDRLSEAKELAIAVVEASRAQFGEGDTLTSDALAELASIYDQLGELAEAEKLFRQILAADERRGDTQTRSHYIAIGNLGQLLRPTGRLDEAAALCLKAYEGIRSISGNDDPIALQMLGNYADVLRLQGDFAKAEPRMREYMEQALRVFGPDDARSINAQQGLAVTLFSAGKREEAMPYFEAALASMRRVMGNEHRETLFQISSFASARVNNGDMEAGGKLFEEAYEGWKKTVGPDHPNTIVALHGIAHVAFMQEQWEQALEPAQRLYQQTLEGRIELSPARRARYLSLYGLTLEKLRRDDEAVAPLLTAYQELLKVEAKGVGNPEAYDAVTTSLSEIETRRGQPEKAEWWRAERNRFVPPEAATRAS